MPKVLIVDDKESNLFALENILKRLDVEVVKALTGEDALEATLNHDFALVILDVQMPAMDGYEIATFLRSDERTKKIPIIFLSAVYLDEWHVFRGYELGAVDFIIKPFDPLVLLSKVIVFLELNEQKIELLRQRNELESLVSQLERQIEVCGRVERDLRESEARYRGLVDSQFDMVVRTDRDGRLLFANDAYCRAFQMSSCGWLGHTRDGDDHTHDWAPLDEVFHAVIAPPYRTRIETRIGTVEGSRWFQWEVAGIRNNEGEVVEIQAAGRDITERKWAEAELAREHSFRDSVIDNVAEGLCVCHEIGEFPFLEFTVWNDRMTEITGYTMEEMNRLGWYQTMHADPEPHAEVAERMKRVWLGEDLRSVERGITRADGTKAILSISTSIVESDDGLVHVLALMQDITDRKKAEQELLKAKKLEAIGTLAGGISHDFNNLLLIILGNIEMARMAMEPQSTFRRHLDDATKAVFRAKEITKEFLTFSTGGAPLKKPAFITDLLKESVVLALGGSKVVCEYFIEDALWQVAVDQGQMSQVFANVVENAKEAMPHGGVLEIRAENMVVDSKTSNSTPSMREGRYVAISIRDHGTGLSRENIDKIFDPYFSTKARSSDKGTGLGLSIAHSIIKKHEGYIHVESLLGVGTTFHIYLPASEGKAAETGEGERGYLPRKGKILLMDDEDLIRDMAMMMLRRLGYEQVELAVHGEEVIQRFREAKESGAPFDVVILDLTVKDGMGGKEAVKELLKIDPSVKAIVSSGYYDDPVLADHREFGFSGVLVKPYLMDELSEVLEEVMPRQPQDKGVSPD